ncbi:MAG TPA: hypothetical protein DCQ29_01985 [Chitinophagaceae bacterium]|nr:hypothetical protein [Chitinophagaceae bacterium]
MSDDLTTLAGEILHYRFASEFQIHCAKEGYDVQFYFFKKRNEPYFDASVECETKDNIKVCRYIQFKGKYAGKCSSSDLIIKSGNHFEAISAKKPYDTIKVIQNKNINPLTGKSKITITDENYDVNNQTDYPGCVIVINPNIDDMDDLDSFIKKYDPLLHSFKYYFTDHYVLQKKKIEKKLENEQKEIKISDMEKCKNFDSLFELLFRSEFKRS